MKIEYLWEDNETYESLCVLVSKNKNAVGSNLDYAGFNVSNCFNSETGEYIGLFIEDYYSEERETILNFKEDEIFEKMNSIDINKHKKKYPSFDEKLYKKQILAIVDFIKKTNPKKMSIAIWESAPTFG